VVKQPGPLRAFYERTRGRRGQGNAIVATARKLAVLFWCVLRRSEDYAQHPALTKKKLRQLELTADAPRAPGPRSGSGAPTARSRPPNARRASRGVYTRMVTDQQAGRPPRKPSASTQQSAHKTGPRRGHSPRG
jgi:transposase